jgi:hypothetical protein
MNPDPGQDFWPDQNGEKNLKPVFVRLPDPKKPVTLK